jgi:hypothetical protein
VRSSAHLAATPERERFVIIEKLKEQLVADPEVRVRIAKRAYEIFLERQGRYAAHPAEDWLRAEAEILPALIQEMIERNEAALRSGDESDPVVVEAASHMRELEGMETEIPPSDASRTASRELMNQNAASLAASRDDKDEDTVPDARAVLESTRPVKKTAVKVAPAKKPDAKRPAAKTAEKKAPAKKAAAKPSAKPAAKPTAKPAEKKAPAKKAAAKASAKKATPKATPKASPKKAAKPANPKTDE